MLTVCLVTAIHASAADDPPDAPSYSDVHVIFLDHCVGCHNATDREGGLVLESYQTLSKGGESGPAFEPGDVEWSEIYLRITSEDKVERMPPADEGEPLNDRQIAVIRRWIEAGASGPKPGEVLPTRRKLPPIEPIVPPRRAIHALAYEPKSKLLAVARHGVVELRSAEHRGLVRTLGGHAGAVNAVAFSADGSLLAAASGLPAQRGEVRLWNTADGSLLKTLEGHDDAIYSVALSPDGKLLATGGYDHTIMLWSVGSGQALHTLSGHNGAVFDLAFRPDGRVLASASADRTVKLWDAGTGRRLDTLSESTGDLYALAFSPDGGHIAAAGADNRIRAWRISDSAAEGTNPILYSRFAHEGAVLDVAFTADGRSLLSSADDRSVKLWNTEDGALRWALTDQPDWPAALILALDDTAAVVGRLDGSLGFYRTADGSVLPPPKPRLAAVEPRGIQTGASVKLKLGGENLVDLTSVQAHHAGLSAELLPDDADRAEIAWVRLTAPADLSPGAYELSVANAGGRSNRLRLHADNLPQLTEAEPNDGAADANGIDLPTDVWGELRDLGDSDGYAFEARAGQTLVIDAAARRIGSKADLVLTLADATGRVLASANDFDDDPDPLLAHTFAGSGRFILTVRDLRLGASAEHYYRLSIGELPLVTAAFPLAVPPNAEASVELSGHNLPADATVRVKAGDSGEVSIAADPDRFRLRRPFGLLVGLPDEGAEAEPNDHPEQATALPSPGAVNGRFLPACDGRTGDVDLFRFTAKAGEAWVIETMAERRGSPADTRIEVLHADGRPVRRLLLRAVRDSAITFRSIDADAAGARLVNWEEMALNQYLYMEGEVVRLFLAPRGPDSEYNFYAIGGKRRAYFDTSPTAHPLDAPCYIVEPLPPDAQPPPNGLPVFPLHYANDDDALRRLGADSRLHFTAPADGEYLIRVTDTRGFAGHRFTYRLLLRRARPDFRLAIVGRDPAVPAGSGLAFTIRLDRIDAFNGPVRLDIADPPPGFTITTPLVVQHGHTEAQGAIFAAADAPAAATTADAAAPAHTAMLTATAEIDGRTVTRQVGDLGAIKLADEPPKVRVWIEPIGSSETVETGGVEVPVITIEPGRRTPALLRIERLDHDQRVSFDLLNLPHGVIVADIGLNGIMILEGQTQRRIFLDCAGWVPETERPFFARAREAGNPASEPLLLRVRRPDRQAAAP